MAKSVDKLIGKVARDIKSAVNTGSYRAINRAVDSTKSKLAKELREDTGLPAAKIKKRLLGVKANSKKLVGAVAIATKVGIPIKDLKAKEVKVKVPGLARKGKTGRPKSRTYYGVSAKIGKQPRQLVPGAFFLKGKTGEAVIGRKQAFNAKGEYINRKAPKYKTTTLRATLVMDSAVARRADAEKHMRDTFEKNIDHEIDFALSKKITK